jgi:hypothetical protein
MNGGGPPWGSGQGFRLRPEQALSNGGMAPVRWVHGTVWLWVVGTSGFAGCGGQTAPSAAIPNGSTDAGAGVADVAPTDAPPDAESDRAAFADAPPDDTGEAESSVDDAAPDVPEGGRDGSNPECTPGEEQGPCNASGTGCPGSFRSCYSDGTWSLCQCKSCTVELDAGACSWTFETWDGLAVPLVIPPSTDGTSAGIVDEDGGTSELPYVGPMAGFEGDCTADGGWYFGSYTGGGVGTLTTLTVVLCPTSCDLHLQAPAIRFEATRACWSS